MTTATYTGFRDPTELTRTTKGLLYVSIPFVLVTIAGDARDHWWLWGRGEEAPAWAPLVESLLGVRIRNVRPCSVRLQRLGADVDSPRQP